MATRINIEEFGKVKTELRSVASELVEKRLRRQEASKELGRRIALSIGFADGIGVVLLSENKFEIIH